MLVVALLLARAADRGGRLCRPHLQRARRAARERAQGLVEHRRAADAASRRAAEAGRDLQALHGLRAGNAGARDAGALGGVRARRAAATSRRSAPPRSSCGRGLGRLFAVAENYPALKADDDVSLTCRRRISRTRGSDCRPPRALQRRGQPEQHPRADVPRPDRRAHVRVQAGASARVRGGRSSATSTWASCLDDASDFWFWLLTLGVRRHRRRRVSRCAGSRSRG